MSTVNNHPIWRLPYAAAHKATPHLHEGKFAIISNGEITIPATATANVVGIISEPDSHATALAGNATTANFIGNSFGGVVRLQLSTAGTMQAHETLLQLDAEGCVKAYGGSGAGAIIVARAAENSSGGKGSLIAATFITPYTTK